MVLYPLALFCSVADISISYFVYKVSALSDEVHSSRIQIMISFSINYTSNVLKSYVIFIGRFYKMA